MNWTPSYSSALFVANGSFPSKELVTFLNHPLKTLVAVDGGLHCFAQVGLRPHLITGDFDSVKSDVINHYEDVQKIFTPDQNKTDLEKALEILETLFLGTIHVCGALGKRIDHTLANISLLTRYPEKVIYETEEESCFSVLKTATISCKVGQRLSLFPLGKVSNVISDGLQWELNGNTLDNSTLAVSNICKKETISLFHEEGDLIVILARDGFSVNSC